MLLDIQHRNQFNYINNNDAQHYTFLQLMLETFEHSILVTNQSKFKIVPIVVEPTNKEMFRKPLIVI